MSELTRQREVSSYHYGPINTPFQTALQTEDHLLGCYLKQAHRWRIFSFLCLGASALILLFFFLELTEPRVRVMVADLFDTGSIAESGLLPQGLAS
jgi:type IV secretory pathway TrbF-like protein